MLRRNGQAYIFVRWSGNPAGPSRLGDVAWAFEYADRQGRFNYFFCGGVESVMSSGSPVSRVSWQEKCPTLPQLVKAMSHQNAERPGYDEAKIFDVNEADPDNAMQWVTQRAATTDDLISSNDSLRETREVLARYGVRGLADGKGFSAPFLWYNMLPGRSVPVRKLPIHLLQLRGAPAVPELPSNADLEDQIRKAAQAAPDVFDLGECFIARTNGAFLVGLTVVVDAKLTVRYAHSIADRLEETIRSIHSQIRHVFIHVEPSE